MKKGYWGRGRRKASNTASLKLVNAKKIRHLLDVESRLLEDSRYPGRSEFSQMVAREVCCKERNIILLKGVSDSLCFSNQVTEHGKTTQMIRWYWIYIWLISRVKLHNWRRAWTTNKVQVDSAKACNLRKEMVIISSLVRKLGVYGMMFLLQDHSAEKIGGLQVYPLWLYLYMNRVAFILVRHTEWHLERWQLVPRDTYV